MLAFQVRHHYFQIGCLIVYIEGSKNNYSMIATLYTKRNCEVFISVVVELVIGLVGEQISMVQDAKRNGHKEEGTHRHLCVCLLPRVCCFLHLASCFISVVVDGTGPIFCFLPAKFVTGVLLMIKAKLPKQLH